MDVLNIERLSLDLDDAARGCTITRLHLSHWLSRRKQSDNLSSLVGWTITKVRRVGKCLVFHCDNPPAGSMYLASRLGSSGIWSLNSSDVDERELRSWAATIDIIHPNGSAKLIWLDRDRSGALEVSPSIRDIQMISGYGPDVSELTTEWMSFVCGNHSIPIKSLLTIPSYFAAISNRQASEILWRAKINPTKRSKDLDRHDIHRLHIAAKTVVLGGGEECVYGADLCMECGSPIKKLLIDRRPTYACLKCQQDHDSSVAFIDGFIDSIEK